MAQPLSSRQERSWFLHRSDPPALSCAHRPRGVADAYREPPDARRVRAVSGVVLGGVSGEERYPGYAERMCAGVRPKSAL